MLWVILALEGCAHALAPMLVSQHSPGCSQDGHDCLARGREAFEDYRRRKLDEIQQKSAGYRLPSAPVAFLHADRTEYSILLVHGLNDSAYYVADLSELMHRSGFNVVTVLLPGHGTATRDMLDASAEQWRAEVDLGIDLAALVGEKVIVGGFSLGSALAIDALMRHTDIEGLLLFSPAIRLQSYDAISGLACAPILRSLEWTTDLPENPVKYKYRMGNGVCQLSRLMQYNLWAGNPTGHGSATVSAQVRELALRVKVPTFVALTYADQRISPDAALEFARTIPAPVVVATFGTPASPHMLVVSNSEKIWPITDKNLGHSFLVRYSNPYNGQENPCFDRLARVLTQFLADHFHAHVEAVDSGYPDCRPFPEVSQGSD